MTTLPFYGDVHGSNLSHDWAVAHSYITFIKVRHVMESIDFINSI